MDLKERAKSMKIMIPALWIAMKRSDTPLAAKILAGLTVGYALSPIDLIPDFIPILGYLDDLVILPILAALAIKLIPVEIMEDCKRQSEDLWSEGTPKKWLYALPILGFWLLIVLWVLTRLFN